jgi:murein DD-endopeptidase MepM/ murein hydrolase activator NlpD
MRLPSFVPVLAVALGFAAISRAEPRVEVRFCPAGQLRPYPLDSQGRQQGLLLQSFTVVNRGPDPFRIDEIDIALMKDGGVVDNRVLDAADIARWAGNGPPLQEVVRQVPFEFCGDQMVAPDVTLAGPVLARNQGLLVARQIFAYDRVRDRLRVSVRGASSGHGATVSASLPISTGFTRTRLAFPLKGTWYVGWGPSFHTGHRAAPPEEFALDIGQLGDGGKTYRGDGARFEDYYAYGASVLAAAAGRVVRASDGRAEDPAMLQQPGESDEAYWKRHAKLQNTLLSQGVDQLAGNYVMIDHGNGEFSLYAHMQPGSVRVKVGDSVKVGDVLGKLGSSGNSTEPHLHFHVCDHPDPLMCAGVPIEFSNISLLWADGPRALQSGDIVTTH